MGGSGSAPDVAPDDVLRVFSQLEQPSSPLTAEEVAEQAASEPETTRNSLEHLAERGVLRTKVIDGGARIWWQSRSGISAQAAVGEEFTAFVDAVQDYAIFMLDPDGVVVSWNEGAERIKGYAEEEIVGQHFSTFYTEEEVADGVPERNLEAAASQGRVEDAGWRVRQDGSEFWADVVITAIRDDDGKLKGFTKVTRDRTEQREYEQQLRRERDLTERILETVPVSICLLTADGDVVRANQRMLDRIGADASELAEYDVESWELYDADGEPIPAEEWPWQRVVDTGEAVHDYECRVDLPDVGRRWLTIDAAPIEDGHREDDLIVVSVDDVTDQKERERRLRREHEQTEKLLRTAPMAIAVKDADGETVMANRRAQDALGLSEEEFLSEPDDVDRWDLYDADGEPIPAEEAPGARALATGEPVFGEEVTIDPPDGAPMQFRVNEAPLYGPDGETVERVVIAAEDVTPLKERERQLEQRKTELETELGEILGRISDAFYALDDEWRFTHLNDQAAEIMQVSEDDVLGERLDEVFPEAEDSVYWEQFQAAMETQEPVSFEVDVEGLGAWLEFNVYPSESGLSIYFRDVTERKAYQRRLEASNERLEQFAYAASHDLQEPLRMVSSYLQLLERRYDDELDQDGREFIEYAVDGADRMREMIEALLEYSRVETEGDPLEPLELDAVVDDALADLQLRIEETDADVTVDSLPRVEGDASQLRQLFQNLLENALTYAGDEPPRIDVSAERAGREWQLSVRDEGIGIDPGEQDAIFQVFQRLHSREEHPGTGIGLALCRRIVERHGGEIWADSEPGEGATFTFTLHAADDGERAG